VTSLRIVVGAIGLAGHTLPALGLGAALRARGHEVLFCGCGRWGEAAVGAGLEFVDGEGSILASATGDDPSLAHAARRMIELARRFDAGVIVGDGLTAAPGLAAEAAGIPGVTLLPEVYPHAPPGSPSFSLGLSAPRTRLGSRAWQALEPIVATRLPSTGWRRPAHAALNRERAELGLAPLARFDDPQPGLTIVATLPQLEYPRRWPERVRISGPIVHDLPAGPAQLPPGDRPLVVLAPSTVKDPAGSLVRTALSALGDEPVRVLVTTGGADLGLAGYDPARASNVLVADWIDYPSALGAASLVICHGNHGTVVRSLLAGVPLVISPAMPDDAEHGARVAWAGAGAMVPARLNGKRALRLAIRRVLADPRFTETARAIAASTTETAGAGAAARMVEEHAGRAVAR
jgi:UDP:flavonoid glycosyltransferase YjiC (YdhE family)